MIQIGIIGGGVVGASVARQLSKYCAKITVLERCNDVAMGASKANSGIVHAGFDAEPGSQKAKFNVLGNALFDTLSEELDFPFRRNGAFVLLFEGGDKDALSKLQAKGNRNGVETKILSGQEARQKVPLLSDAVQAALYAPSSGITSPYEMTIAVAENAAANGAEFVFDACVTRITPTKKGYTVEAGAKTYDFDVVVNCAGVYADQISNDAIGSKYHITARKGEYVLLDKARADMTHLTLFQTPTKMGKGILVSPTAHGNIIVGPTAADITDKDCADTSYEGLTEVLVKARMTIPSLGKRDIITQFTGLRAHEQGDDFIVKREAQGFYNALGIESPGLTSAPAIAEYLATLIAKDFALAPNQKFQPRRKGIARFVELNSEQRQRLIAENPQYGKIVCRCETVTEGEIVESIHRTPGAKDLDGVKRRTRAGMGRCQAGFCTMRVMEILARELNIPIEKVTKNGRGWMIAERGQEEKKQ